MSGAHIARTAAVLIAIAAAIDPAWTRTRLVPVPVSLVYEPGSAALAAAIRRDLAGEFAVTDGPAVDSQAAVLVRAIDRPLPPVPETGRIFVVDDPVSAPPVRIRSVQTPRIALQGRSVAVTVVVDISEPLDDPLTTELRAAGRLAGNDERRAPQQGQVRITIPFVPAVTGLVPLQIAVTAGSHKASADAVIAVQQRKLRVLFVDQHPSWSSTFVRRALEQDSAFDVSARTITSRGVSVTTGGGARFDDPSVRESIDAVVAGTPSALPAGELRALQSFAQERGGAVVLLADRDAARVFEAMTGVRWQRRMFGEAVTVGAGHGSLMLSEALVPASSVPAAVTLAVHNAAGPIVQDIAAGHGRVIVSGALDAWRNRVATGSTFAAFWRGVIGDAVLAAAAPLSVRFARQRAKPEERIGVEVVVRDAHAGRSVTIEGALEAGGGAIPVRFWPAFAPGVFTAHVTAPAHEGTAVLKVAVVDSGRRLEGFAPLLTARSESLANTPAGAPSVLAASRGGTYIADGSTGALRQALRDAFPAHAAPVTTHPMRYAWWLAPFTLLLAYEWRWRRRRGLK